MEAAVGGQMLSTWPGAGGGGRGRGASVGCIIYLPRGAGMRVEEPDPGDPGTGGPGPPAGDWAAPISGPERGGFDGPQ